MTKWKLVPGEPTPEMFVDIQASLMREGSFIGSEILREWYRFMLRAAPQPPRLSDERILEVAESEAVLLVERGNFTGRLYVTNSVSSVYALARAIEREILGGSEK